MMKDKGFLAIMMIATGGLAALALPFVRQKYRSPKERLQRRLEKRQKRKQAREQSKQDDTHREADK